MAVDPSAKTNELYKVAENGLKEVGVDYPFSNHTGKRKPQDSSGAMETEDHDVYELAGALENIIKQSQVEIIDLKQVILQTLLLRRRSSAVNRHFLLHYLDLRRHWKRVRKSRRF
ncbi:hypothetical protein LIER_44139 [Lithospermum erythrorhizon]|uniref:Uncharacterized protein n=1 Tax=Lithospermum erythrorhizon TaxID=34254 RepID=A0AAV3QE36_LITER